MRLDENRSCALCDDIATGSMELIGIGIVDLCAHCQRSHSRAAELRAAVRREKAGDFMMRYQAAVEQRTILAAWDRAVAEWRADPQNRHVRGSRYEQSLTEFKRVVFDVLTSYDYCGPAMTAYGE